MHKMGVSGAADDNTHGSSMSVDYEETLLSYYCLHEWYQNKTKYKLIVRDVNIISEIEKECGLDRSRKVTNESPDQQSKQNGDTTHLINHILLNVEQRKVLSMQLCSVIDRQDCHRISTKRQFPVERRPMGKENTNSLAEALDSQRGNILDGCEDKTEGDEIDWVYFDLPEPREGTASDDPSVWNRVGRLFVDTDDDVTYLVTGVCTSSILLGLFYSYIPVDRFPLPTLSAISNDARAEFSSCEEMNEPAAWVHWL